MTYNNNNNNNNVRIIIRSFFLSLPLSLFRHRSWIRICLVLTIMIGTILYISLQLSQVSMTLLSKNTSLSATTTLISMPSTTSKGKMLFVQDSMQVTFEKRYKRYLGPIFYNIFIPNITNNNNNETTTTTTTTMNVSLNPQQNAWRIVQEQMQQIQWSDPNSQVIYTLIGPSSSSSIIHFTNTTTTTTTFRSNQTINHSNNNKNNIDIINSIICPQSNINNNNNNNNNTLSPRCHCSAQLPHGNEVNTLQTLYDYCQDESHYHQIVTYIHNKGSFHSTQHNEQTRRTATKAALDCRMEMIKNNRNYNNNNNNHNNNNDDDDIDNDDYNVCAGTMIILPQYLCNANMWTAKCSYVKNLIPPKDYAIAMEQFYKNTLLPQKVTKITTTTTTTTSTTNSTFNTSINNGDNDMIYNSNNHNNNNHNNYTKSYTCLRPIQWTENHVGLGRYAYERWIWSHPDVIPADVIPPIMSSVKIKQFYNFPPTWKPTLGPSLTGSPKRMGLDRGLGESSFARLEGRLFEWQYLYQKQPSNHSWIWDYYKGYETGTLAFKIRYCLE